MLVCYPVQQEMCPKIIIILSLVFCLTQPEFLSCLLLFSSHWNANNDTSIKKQKYYAFSIPLQGKKKKHREEVKFLCLAWAGSHGKPLHLFQSCACRPWASGSSNQPQRQLPKQRELARKIHSCQNKAQSLIVVPPVQTQSEFFLPQVHHHQSPLDQGSKMGLYCKY